MRRSNKSANCLSLPFQNANYGVDISCPKVDGIYKRVFDEKSLFSKVDINISARRGDIGLPMGRPGWPSHGYSLICDIYLELF